jgi:hypothetical protein
LGTHAPGAQFILVLIYIAVHNGFLLAQGNWTIAAVGLCVFKQPKEGTFAERFKSFEVYV